jgi:hypothetical protein
MLLAAVVLLAALVGLLLQFGRCLRLPASFHLPRMQAAERARLV